MPNKPDVLPFAKDILYVMLVAGGRIVTLIRPRKHSIHPAGKRNFPSSTSLKIYMRTQISTFF